MDRKDKVDYSAAGNSSGNGTKSRDAALDKLRKMEWMRNKQDSWHLARSNSKGASDVHERKKYNKDEDNYFEGTSVQKTKKQRRPRVSESCPSFPNGITMNNVPAAPPQVNAWKQKKGSALFQKNEEVDEEDQVLKLVLQESLRTAEEDRKRYFERLRMTNLDVPSSLGTVNPKNHWDEEIEQKDVATSPHSSELNEDTSPELHFIDSDTEETPQKQRHKPPKNKVRAPQERSYSLSESNNFELPESQKETPSLSTIKTNNHHKESLSNVPQAAANETCNDDLFKSSHPQSKYSKPMMTDTLHNTTSPLSSYVTTDTNKQTTQRSSVKDNTVVADNLSTGLKSALTLGDTQDHNQKPSEVYPYNHTDVIQHFRTEKIDYIPNEPDRSTQGKSTSTTDPSETDIMLHNFIRHDPPSNINAYTNQSVSGIYPIENAGSSKFATISHFYTPQGLNSSYPCVTRGIPNSDQHLLLNGRSVVNLQTPNEHDSSSSLSESPLPNITQYNSFEKQITSNIGAPSPVQTPHQSIHMPYPMGVENTQEGNINPHLQVVQLVNQNVAQTAEYSSLPPNVRNLMQLNSQMGIPPYRLPNTNLMAPQYHGHEVHSISSQILHNQLQQAQLQQAQLPPGYFQQMMALNTLRLNQHAQLAASSSESDDNTKKEQGDANNQQSVFNNQQLFTQNQPQLLTHNQPHLIQLQTHPQTQIQQGAIPSVESAMPNQEQLKQTNILQSPMTPGGNKSQEELIIKYQQTLEMLNQLQQEMQVQNQPPNLSLSQPQTTWGVYGPGHTLSGVNNFYPGMAIVHNPHLIQQTQTTGPISPTMFHQQTVSGLMNVAPEMNLDSEADAVRESSQMLQEFKTGRGRGRLP